MKLFGTRPSLARQRVSGAMTTRFGSVQAPTFNGESKSDMGLASFRAMRAPVAPVTRIALSVTGSPWTPGRSI